MLGLQASIQTARIGPSQAMSILTGEDFQKQLS